MLLFFAMLTQSFALTQSQPALENYWNANVMIRAEAWDADTQTTIPGYCNATFISAQKLLTAAHCVVQAQAMKKLSLEIQVGAYKYVTRPDGTVGRIGYVAQDKLTVPVHFQFLPGLTQKIISQGVNVQVGPDEDIAIIELDQPWIGNVQMNFPKVLPIEKENLLKQSLNNKMVVMTINFMEEMSTDIKRNATLNDVTNNSAHFESNSSVRVQEGDSGGALYVVEGNQYYLVGVVKGRAETFFSNWDVYTNGLRILRSNGF